MSDKKGYYKNGVFVEGERPEWKRPERKVMMDGRLDTFTDDSWARKMDRERMYPEDRERLEREEREREEKRNRDFKKAIEDDANEKYYDYLQNYEFPF